MEKREILNLYGREKRIENLESGRIKVRVKVTTVWWKSGFCAAGAHDRTRFGDSEDRFENEYWYSCIVRSGGAEAYVDGGWTTVRLRGVCIAATKKYTLHYFAFCVLEESWLCLVGRFSHGSPVSDTGLG